MELPKRYDPAVSEPKWQTFWQKNKVFKYDNKSKKETFSIDTPPPYASADHLHVGHGMSYSQFEFVARYKRMRGFNVFFPMGFDDNGLPTERFVEKKHKINKNKTTRAEFTTLCLAATKIAGETYHDLFTRLGFSIDWSLLFHTIDERSQRVAQKSFIDLYKKGLLERVDSPTTWCTKCQTAVAQADLESVDMSSHFNDIIFKSSTSSGKDLIIGTTRPELLPACVALFYHPTDKRYQKLKGSFAKVPLFDYEVPVLSDEAVDPEKGTGLMMVCSFGDKEDIEKWHKHKLPLRLAITPWGKMNDLAQKYESLSIKDARKQIIADLKEKNLLTSQEEISHSVNVHERCSTPIEFLKTKQWQIKVLDKKQELIDIAQKITWRPEHMKVRYEHWVQNLQWNWGISRQRFYGVPFPVWYTQKGEIVLPDEKHLPVDPREKKFPDKHKEKDTLIGEQDVMDTWMTSSVTPQINANWGSSDERSGFMPMSLRPQAHDIIRTWAFYTIVKSYYHHNAIPWKTIMISGHGQDPHGQKMSKSKGNFVVAQDVIQKYSADAFRFWAASVKLGDDLPYQEKDVLTGQKFINKLWNASKFSITHLEDFKSGDITQTIDKWLVSKLQHIIQNSTQCFEEFEYSKTKNEVEKFFWHTFCDQYLEIAKDRLYNPDVRGVAQRTSAQATLSYVLSSILKLIAPILPHITEEVYQLYFAKNEKIISIHIASWPQFESSRVDETSEKAGDVAVDIINSVRKYKSDNQLSLKEDLKSITIICDEETKQLITSIESDLKSVCKANELLFKGKAPITTDNGLKIGICQK